MFSSNSKVKKLRQQQEIELRRLELEMSCTPVHVDSSVPSGAGERLSFKMTDLMRPYKVEDIGLFLVNFERTCEKAQFARETWPQRLLTLLPGEASDVMAPLPKEEAEDYDKVKSGLLHKCRLSAELLPKVS